MSITWTTYVNQLTTLLVATTGDVNFTTILPGIIDYAENRLYRELDLLNTIVRPTGTLTAGARTFALPTSAGTFVVVEQMNVITPSTATTADSGTRNPLQPISKESLDRMWPSVTGSTVPQYFAMITQGTCVVGPWPAAAYTVEVVGTVRPTALSSSNTTTLLSVYFPDLFIAASMVFAAGYQRDYGAQSDDPNKSASWEQQYQALMASAATEEARKKFGAQGWSSKQPDKIASPPRT